MNFSKLVYLHLLVNFYSLCSTNQERRNDIDDYHTILNTINKDEDKLVNSENSLEKNNIMTNNGKKYDNQYTKFRNNINGIYVSENSEKYYESNNDINNDKQSDINKNNNNINYYNNINNNIINNNNISNNNDNNDNKNGGNNREIHSINGNILTDSDNHKKRRKLYFEGKKLHISNKRKLKNGKKSKKKGLLVIPGLGRIDRLKIVLYNIQLLISLLLS